LRLNAIEARRGWRIAQSRLFVDKSAEHAPGRSAPIGFAIVPVSELTIVLLLVLTADAAIGFLLSEDLRGMAGRSGRQGCRPSIRVRRRQRCAVSFCSFSVR
jgi:hypothetical protein